MTEPDNDDFLSRLREPPRPEFAATLYARLHDERSTGMVAEYVAPVARHALRYVAALCLLCGIAATASPSARAGMLETVQRLRQIGGATFVEGIVRLTQARQFTGAFGHAEVGRVRYSGQRRGAGDDPPGSEALGSRLAVGLGGEAVAA